MHYDIALSQGLGLNFVGFRENRLHTKTANAVAVTVWSFRIIQACMTRKSSYICAEMIAHWISTCSRGLYLNCGLGVIDSNLYNP